MMNLIIPDDIEQQLKMVAEHNHVTPSEFVLSLLKDAIKQQQNNSAAQLRALFKQTQNLPNSRSLTDEDIEIEIENYRNGLLKSKKRLGEKQL